MKENKRYKRLKTAKWISIRKLVPGLLLTVRSAGIYKINTWLEYILNGKDVIGVSLTGFGKSLIFISCHHIIARNMGHFVPARLLALIRLI